MHTENNRKQNKQLITLTPCSNQEETELPETNNFAFLN